MAEPTIAKVTIQTSGGVTVFNPKSQTINLNDSVFWANETSEAHQPAPDGGTADQWLTQPIPKRLLGGPPQVSPQVVFDTPPPSGQNGFPYHCAIHPNNASEKGVIVIKS